MRATIFRLAPTAAALAAFHILSIASIGDGQQPDPPRADPPATRDDVGPRDDPAPREAGPRDPRAGDDRYDRGGRPRDGRGPDDPRRGGFGQGGYPPGPGGGFPGGPRGSGTGFGMLGGPPDREMLELEQSDQSYDRQNLDLAERCRRADESERGRLKEELRASIAAHFEVRQKKRQLQLKRIEEEVKRLREAIEKRESTRDAIIDRRFAELVGEEPEPGF